MRMVKDGSNGRGKQRTQTSGRIKLDWQMVGFHKILLIINSRIFVGVLQDVRTRNLPPFFSFFSHFLHDLTRTLRVVLRITCPEGLEFVFLLHIF